MTEKGKAASLPFPSLREPSERTRQHIQYHRGATVIQAIIAGIIILAIAAALLALFARAAVYEVVPAVKPGSSSYAQNRAGMAYTAPNRYPLNYQFSQAEINNLLVGTENTATLRVLIWCESRNQNIAHLDSNHLMSYGILQFNGRATWDYFASLVFANTSTPMNPVKAIAVADWMISHGELHRWSCAKISDLL